METVKKQKKDKDGLKEQILDVGLTVFSTNGFQDTSMQDIASAVGVSRGPLYYYFKDKDQLFQSVLTRSNEAMEELVTDIFSGDDPFFDKIKKELEIFFDPDHRAGERLRQIVRNNPESHEESYADLVNSRKVVRYIKIHAAKQALNKGELRADIDVNQLIDVLFIIHRGILSERKFWEESQSYEKAVDMVNVSVEMLRKQYGVI